MPRGDLDAAEIEAGRIVAEQLGGRAVLRDVPGAGDAVHDLDIEIPGGGRIAVEVTSAADPEIEALAKIALHRVRETPTLSRHWWLTLPRDGSLKVKPLMARVVGHLETLERHEVEQVPRRTGEPLDSEAAAAARAIFALGADRATSSPTAGGETARIVASLHGGVGSDFDTMNTLVAERAHEKADKLLAADGDEKHLFVWVLASAAGAELAIATLPPPEGAPAIPEGIDVVWVATEAGKLLRLVPPGPWETIR